MTLWIYEEIWCRRQWTIWIGELIKGGQNRHFERLKTKQNTEKQQQQQEQKSGWWNRKEMSAIVRNRNWIKKGIELNRHKETFKTGQ